MMEVQEYQISNKAIYAEFNIDPVERILASRQLRWISKIAHMDESCLPKKFLAVWYRNPRPVGRRQMTIRHSYIHVLRMIGAISEDDKAGKLSDWFPQVMDDTKTWERRRKLLMPNKPGQKDCNKIFGPIQYITGKVDFEN
eukprot:15028804-Ditylum_brightwellii.AAC.1